jgi:hypothetical protein
VFVNRGGGSGPVVKFPLALPTGAPSRSKPSTVYVYVRFALNLPMVIVVEPVAEICMKRATNGSTPWVWYVTETCATLAPVVT